ncbi:MAG TPA: hypothetical protein PK264_18280, partial [Hyphomicrobiaceae bacterium]|nr:hypothetical protein [Hyphomicrobiaceae bacterium]
MVREVIQTLRFVSSVRRGHDTAGRICEAFHLLIGSNRSLRTIERSHGPMALSKADVSVKTDVFAGRLLLELHELATPAATCRSTGGKS